MEVVGREVGLSIFCAVLEPGQFTFLKPLKNKVATEQKTCLYGVCCPVNPQVSCTEAPVANINGELV